MRIWKWLAGITILIVIVVVVVVMQFTESRAWKMAMMASARNLPISMYGKVIDQHGQPVAGAVVKFMVAGGGSFAPGSGPVKVTTDKNGIFHLQAKGQDFTVGGVLHKQLALVHYRIGKYYISDSDRLVATDQYEKDSNWRNYSTPDNPYIIHTWRVEKFENVEYSGAMWIPPDGTWVERAGLAIRCVRDEKVPNVHWRHQKGSWSVTFRPIEGGLQETGDLYQNLAPESGYQSELTVSMQRGEPGYRAYINESKRYYYTALSGKIYGSFIVAELTPYERAESCFVKVITKYNKNNSRNIADRPRRIMDIHAF